VWQWLLSKCVKSVSKHTLVSPLFTYYYDKAPPWNVQIVTDLYLIVTMFIFDFKFGILSWRTNGSGRNKDLDRQPD